MTRSFRFGVQQARGGTRAAWRDLARQSEAAGFSTILVPDHFDGPLAPFVALMAAADATSRLRVGTRVIANDFRNPLLLAQEAATLDLLTDGRLELGLGAGWMTADYRSAGVKLDPAEVRVERLGESIRIIRSLLVDGAMSQDGEHYRIHHLGRRPPPAQAVIPIMVGGGSRRILRLAGGVADIVSVHHDLRHGSQNLAPVTAEITDRKIEWVRQGAGNRFTEIELEIGIDVICCTNHARRAVADWSRRLRVPIPQLDTMPNVLIGSEQRIVDLLRYRRERFGFSYVVFQGRDMDVAGPIVRTLAGG